MLSTIQALEDIQPPTVDLNKNHSQDNPSVEHGQDFPCVTETDLAIELTRLVPNFYYLQIRRLMFEYEACLTPPHQLGTTIVVWRSTWSKVRF